MKVEIKPRTFSSLTTGSLMSLKTNTEMVTQSRRFATKLFKSNDTIRIQKTVKRCCRTDRPDENDCKVKSTTVERMTMYKQKDKKNHIYNLFRMEIYASRYSVSDCKLMPFFCLLINIISDIKRFPRNLSESKILTSSQSNS